MQLYRKLRLLTGFNTMGILPHWNGQNDPSHYAPSRAFLIVREIKLLNSCLALSGCAKIPAELQSAV